MADFVITEGDQAVFMPAFGAAVVISHPGVMQASGKTSVGGKKICLKGDEGKLSVPGCVYVAGAYSIPGMGTIKIDALGGDQLSKKAKSGNKEIIIKGNMFTAKFEVQSPAQQPNIPNPIPDALTQYSGSGKFITTNIKFRVD